MKFMPWHTTQAIINGITGLNRIYQSLADSKGSNSSALRLFIDQNCSHLLEELKGDTGIPVNYAYPKVLSNLPDSVRLESSYSLKQFDSLSGSTGVYVFFTDNEVVQCGSSTRFSNRMRSHYLSMDNGIFMFGTYPANFYNWVPVKCTPDYVEMYASTHEMTQQEEQILTFFLQQEIRSLEQAYSTFVNPSNYKGIHVNMWHAKWKPGDSYNPMSTGKLITWTTLEGKTYSRTSMASAVGELGYSPSRMSAVAKIEGAMLNTDKYGPVSVTVLGISKGSNYPDLRSGTPINTLVNVSTIKPNMYYLYDADMNLLPYGPFKSSREVNKALSLPIDYSGIKTWCNYMHLIKSEAIGISVYVYKHHTNTPMPMIVTRLSDNDTKEYPSVKSVCEALSTNTQVVMHRVATNTVFKCNDGFTYSILAKYPEGLAKLSERYAKKIDKSSK